MIVGTDAFFNSRRDPIIALATRHRLPAIYPGRECRAGGLMSYGTNIHRCIPSRRHLHRPHSQGRRSRRDLPVVQPTKIELAINLKTAKALGLDVPATLLARADEVIE